MTFNAAGFVLGQALARDNGLTGDEAARAGLVAAFMPSPLVGAIIVSELGGEVPPRRRRRPQQPTHTSNPTHEQIEEARKQAIQELEKVLEELRRHQPT